MIYLIGSLRNTEVPVIANLLRQEGFDIFDDWYAAGPEADDYWQRYELARSHSYKEALSGYPAKHVYEYDKFHLDRASAAVLVLPAGKSAFLELGYIVGQRKPGFILMTEEPERYDVMFQFATVLNSFEELIKELKSVKV